VVEPRGAEPERAEAQHGAVRLGGDGRQGSGRKPPCSLKRVRGQAAAPVAHFRDLERQVGRMRSARFQV
jgi:hypothetical protein